MNKGNAIKYTKKGFIRLTAYQIEEPIDEILIKI